MGIRLSNLSVSNIIRFVFLPQTDTNSHSEYYGHGIYRIMFGGPPTHWHISESTDPAVAWLRRVTGIQDSADSASKPDIFDAHVISTLFHIRKSNISMDTKNRSLYFEVIVSSEYSYLSVSVMKMSPSSGDRMAGRTSNHNSNSNANSNANTSGPENAMPTNTNLNHSHSQSTNSRSTNTRPTNPRPINVKPSHTQLCYTEQLTRGEWARTINLAPFLSYNDQNYTVVSSVPSQGSSSPHNSNLRIEMGEDQSSQEQPKEELESYIILISISEKQVKSDDQKYCREETWVSLNESLNIMSSKQVFYANIGYLQKRRRDKKTRKYIIADVYQQHDENSLTQRRNVQNSNLISPTSSQPSNPLYNTTISDNSTMNVDVQNPCVICIAEQTSCVSIPCRHLCMCKGCSDALLNQPRSLHRCPLCRCEISSIVYMNENPPLQIPS